MEGLGRGVGFVDEDQAVGVETGLGFEPGAAASRCAEADNHPQEVIGIVQAWLHGLMGLGGPANAGLPCLDHCSNSVGRATAHTPLGASASIRRDQAAHILEPA